MTCPVYATVQYRDFYMVPEQRSHVYLVGLYINRKSNLLHRKKTCRIGFSLQGYQLYMALCFWYLVKRDLSSVRYWTVYKKYIIGFSIQGDQLYMALCFWYLVKRDLSSVRYWTVAYTSVTFYKVPEQHGQVYLCICT